MHRLVDSIFRKHEAWLKAGGDQSLEVVKTSNLMAFVSEGLDAAEAAGDAAGAKRVREQTDNELRAVRQRNRELQEQVDALAREVEELAGRRQGTTASALDRPA